LNLLNAPSNKSTPTATELLSAPQTLELLRRLRDTVRDLTHRATEATRDHESRATKLRAQLQQTVEREREQAAAASEAEKAAVAAQRSQTETFSLARNKRIGRATQNSRERKLAQIESEEGRRTFEIQRDLLEAERKRDEDLKNARSTMEAFNARLAGELASLQRTELRARGVLSPYRSLARLLAHPPETKPDLSTHENQLADKLHESIAAANHELSRCQSFILPLLFRIPVWVWILVAVVMPFAFVPELRQFNFSAVPSNIWAIMVGSVVGLIVLFVLSRQLAAPAARAAAVALENARKLYDAAAAKVVTSHTQAVEQARLVFTSTQQMLNNNWKQIQAEARSLRKDWTTRFEDQTRKLHTANQDRAHRKQSQLDSDHTTRMEKLMADAGARRKALEAVHQENLAKLNAGHDTTRQAIDSEWRTVVVPLFERLQAARVAAEEQFPPWHTELWTSFTPPDEFLQAARFGELQVDFEKLCGVSLAGGRLQLSGEQRFPLPLLLLIPDAGSLLFETKTSGHEQIIGDLNSIVIRLLTSAPPGRLAFTIFDPVGLGQNFAGIMHLADFEERVINSRIWTQQAQFEQKLADLNEHIEKVTQMYLRNEYASLAEYNAQAGRLAEKYQFLVIADFPVNFSDVAVKRLQSIIASGPRCGVYTLIHWDQRRSAPVELVPDELRKNSLRIMPKGDSFGVAGADWDGIKLTLDAPPDSELATHLLQQKGQRGFLSCRNAV
jgi:DNA segregation ATPase FtsK/SpoIIIE, S-DNA-T family